MTSWGLRSAIRLTNAEMISFSDALPNVRGADRGHFPVLFPALGDQRAYADD